MLAEDKGDDKNEIAKKESNREMKTTSVLFAMKNNGRENQGSIQS